MLDTHFFIITCTFLSKTVRLHWTLNRRRKRVLLNLRFCFKKHIKEIYNPFIHPFIRLLSLSLSPSLSLPLSPRPRGNLAQLKTQQLENMCCCWLKQHFVEISLTMKVLCPPRASEATLATYTTGHPVTSWKVTKTGTNSVTVTQLVTQ